MRKALKFLAYLLAGLAVCIGLGAAFFQVNGIPAYPVNAPVFSYTADSVHIAEGKRLVGMTCAHCHRGAGGRLEGRLFSMNNELGAENYTANITQDAEHGIGRYSPGELAFLLRTGIKRNGEFARPWMPRFARLSDEDLGCIIAYLRSGEEAVQATPTAQPAFQPSLLYKVLANLAIKPLAYPASPIQAPPATDQVALGRYLATGRYMCYACHSAAFKSNNEAAPEQSAGFFAGGNPTEDEEFHVVHSANLTPDAATGLGRWTEAQFLDAVRFGRRPDGRPLRAPMLPYAAMREDEAKAIWAYLQTLPPVNHAVERNF